MVLEPPRLKGKPPACAARTAFDVNYQIGTDILNVHSTPPPRQAVGIDIHAPYLIARTFRELQERGLPIDAASLQSLPFLCDGRPTEAPYIVRVVISEEARR